LKVLFISDIHLGSKGSQSKKLLEVLKDETPDKLFIVGDFIDGWLLKKRWFWKQTETNVVRKILSYTKKGVEVIWVTGNHDDFMRQFTPIQFGENFKVVDEIVWNDYLITHGDLYDGVVKLKWLGKLGAFGYETAIGIDTFLRKFGCKRSLSSFLKQKVKRAVKFMTTFEKQLGYQAIQNNCKGVICGHIHKPTEKWMEVQNQKIHYLNCGDWLEHNSYILFEDGKFSLISK